MHARACGAQRPARAGHLKLRLRCGRPETHASATRQAGSKGRRSGRCRGGIRHASLNQYPTPCMTTPRSRKVTVPASPKSSLPMSTSRTVRATKRKAVFSRFILRLFPGGGTVNRLPRLRFGLVLGEAADPRLVGDAQLIHRVVVGVGDVVAALRIER